MENQANKGNYVSDKLMNVMWDQFEDTVARSRKRREIQRESYIKALKETTKFNEESRNTMKGLFKETSKANRDFLNEFSSRSQTLGQLENSYGQWNDVANKLNEMTMFPIKSSFDLINSMEKRIEKNTENYFDYIQERENAWNSVSNEYIKLARTNQQKFVHRLEDSFKLFVEAR